MKNLFIALVAVVAIGLASCGSTDCSETARATAALDLLETSSAYEQDSSDANCEAYKKALENGIDLEGCEEVTQSEIDNFKALLADLDC